jgi:hypothetical protein
VELVTGKLESLYPAVAIQTAGDTAEFTLTGGLGFVPVSFNGLRSPRGHALYLDGQPLDQSVHGSDFWQTDYDPVAQRWSRTYNIPAAGHQPRTIQLRASVSRWFRHCIQRATPAHAAAEQLQGADLAPELSVHAVTAHGGVEIADRQRTNIGGHRASVVGSFAVQGEMATW